MKTCVRLSCIVPQLWRVGMSWRCHYACSGMRPMQVCRTLPQSLVRLILDWLSKAFSRIPCRSAERKHEGHARRTPRLQTLL